MRALTENQKWVIEELRRQNCFFIAAVTKTAWEDGRTYYLDSRVSVKGVRRKFEQGNKEALEAEK